MSLMSQHPPDIRHVVVHAARAEARADGSYVVEAEHVLLAWPTRRVRRRSGC